MPYRVGDVPEGYYPFTNVEVCDNTSIRGGVLFETEDHFVPLWIGWAEDGPKVWLSGRTGSDDGWVDLLKANQSLVDWPRLNVNPVTHNDQYWLWISASGTRILEVVQPGGPDLAVIRKLDLRPLGVDVHGDLGGLRATMRGQLLEGNQIMYRLASSKADAHWYRRDDWPCAVEATPLYRVYTRELYWLAHDLKRRADQLFEITAFEEPILMAWPNAAVALALVNDVLSNGAKIRHLLSAHRHKPLHRGRVAALDQLVAGLDLTQVRNVKVRNTVEHFAEYLDDCNLHLLTEYPITSKEPHFAVAANFVISSWERVRDNSISLPLQGAPRAGPNDTAISRTGVCGGGTDLLQFRIVNQY